MATIKGSQANEKVVIKKQPSQTRNNGVIFPAHDRCLPGKRDPAPPKRFPQKVPWEREVQVGLKKRQIRLKRGVREQSLQNKVAGFG